MFCFKAKSKYQTKLLTYFIPAPTHNIKGYRERQLDHIINNILEQGFSIENLQTNTINTDGTSGMWLIFQLRPQTATANNIDLNQLLDEIEDNLSRPTHEHVEGLYSIE